MQKLATLAAGVVISCFAVAHTASASESPIFPFSCGPQTNRISCEPSGLISDSSGNLYGETEYGGSGSYCGTNLNGCGTVFELSPNGQGGYTYRLLYSFCSQLFCTDGATPSGGLIFDVAGNLYGTTQTGGEQGFGVVFRLAPAGRAITTLYNFCSDATCAAGGTPTTGLTYLGQTYDGVSPLFGTTSSQSGSGTGGTVYELPAPGNLNSAKLLHTFNCSQSCQPSTLVSDAYTDNAVGNLYGTTTYGGVNGNVFELRSTPDGYTFQLLYSFCQTDCSDGQYPSGNLVIDYGGNLYGTTQQGGVYGAGEAYELAPAGQLVGNWPFCEDCGGIDTGGVPIGGLAANAPPPYKGETFNLYGTTSQAGTAGGGTVFVLPWSSNEPAVCYAFGGLADGGTSQTPVVVNSSRSIFGTTSAGGTLPTGSGVAFEAGC